MTRCTFISIGRQLAVVAMITLSLCGLFSCEQAREERVLDIEAPGVDIEVNKTNGEDGIDSVEIEAGSTE